MIKQGYVIVIITRDAKGYVSKFDDKLEISKTLDGALFDKSKSHLETLWTQYLIDHSTWEEQTDPDWGIKWMALVNKNKLSFTMEKM